MFKLTDFSLEHIFSFLFHWLWQELLMLHIIFILFFSHYRACSDTDTLFSLCKEIPHHFSTSCVFYPLAHVLLHAPAKNRNKRFFMINFCTQRGEKDAREMRDILCGFSGGVARKATWQSVWKSQERCANGFDESTECVCMSDGTACHTLAGGLWWENEWEEYVVGRESFSSRLLCSHRYASIHGPESSHWKQHTTARSKKRRGKKSICKFIHLIKT